MYKAWICKHRGHDFAGGSITPPYEPPRCRRCGFVLAERAGISYADFMGKAQRVLDSNVRITPGTIQTGGINASKIAFPERD